MSRRSWLWRASRYGMSRMWSGVRPGAMTDLRGHRVEEAPRDGTPPRPDQVFVPATTVTGPWAGIDPLVADPWPSRAGALAGLAMSAWLGLRVRRQVTAMLAESSTPPSG